MTKPIAEISNPSDPYTIELDEDRMPACVAVLMLGEGRYGLHTDEESVMPIFLFDGAEPWLAERGVTSLGDYIDANASRIAAALDTVLIGSRVERVAFERVLAAIKSDEDRTAARAAWLDGNRSSLNNIGAYAVQLAARLHERIAARPQ